MAIHFTAATDVARQGESRPVPPSGAAEGQSAQNQQEAKSLELEPREIERSVAALEEAMRHFNRKIHLSYNRTLNRVIVKVVDGSTDKVIKEIPTAEIQRLMARIRETIGVLVDEQR